MGLTEGLRKGIVRNVSLGLVGLLSIGGFSGCVDPSQYQNQQRQPQNYQQKRISYEEWLAGAYAKEELKSNSSSSDDWNLLSLGLDLMGLSPHASVRDATTAALASRAARTKAEIEGQKEAAGVIAGGKQVKYFDGVLQNGARYRGEIDVGSKRPHGVGSYYASDGKIVFEGKVSYGDMKEGVLYNENGSRYIGVLLGGKRDGHGKLINPEGKEVAEGEWRGDSLVFGEVALGSNERKYIGSFKDGKIHGKGKMIDKNGKVIIEGEWINGKYNHGLPEVFFSNGFYDKDGDGHWIPNEFENKRVGTENIFGREEKVAVTSLWKVINKDLNGKKVTLDVFGVENGKIVRDFGFIEGKKYTDGVIRTESDRETEWVSTYVLPVKELEEKVGGSRFKVMWKLDGKEIPGKTGEFNIRK